MTLPIIWYFMIGFLFTVYAILDGWDLGVGALFPYLAQNDGERRLLFRAIGPIWDGNEVWLVTGGAGLFAAFPAAYATIFSGFYSALMLVLFALILRAAAIEFWHHDDVRRGFWKWAFTLGSVLPPLLLGIGLGSVIAGIPLDRQGDFTWRGGLGVLFRPFPLCVGVLALSGVLLQGAAFATAKTSGAAADRGRRMLRRLLLPHLGAAFLCLLLSRSAVPSPGLKWLLWLGGAYFLIFWLLLAASRRSDRLSLIFSSQLFIGLDMMAAGLNYPYLVRATNDPQLGLTLANAASSPLSLRTMLVIAVVGMPLVLGYTVYAYKVFRGRIQAEK